MNTIIPANAGIHFDLRDLIESQGPIYQTKIKLDPGFRWDDDLEN